MNIQFDSSISQPEAQGIILLLQSLFPSTAASTPVNSLTPQLSDPPLTLSAGPTLVQSEAPATDQPKRTRRTKAEIAADEAAAKSAADTSLGATQAEVTAQREAMTTATEAKPITKEELTALVNGYISRHSMEDAIATLRDFGCSRINEALAMDPAKLADLAGKLNA